jgi:two-component system, chemotaxis family, sensor kinase CheA
VDKMTDKISREPMLDMFIFETSKLNEQLEQLILKSEENGTLDSSSINEIFRIMHTIKSSAAMMLFDGISVLAHSVEDLFYFIREEKPKSIDYSKLFDLVLKSVDFIKDNIERIENNDNVNDDSSELVSESKNLLVILKGDNKQEQKGSGKKSKSSTNKADNKSIENNKKSDISKPPKKQRYYIRAIPKSIDEEKETFKANIRFIDGCEMENIRAFTLIHNLKESVNVIRHIPENVIDNEDSIDYIRMNGFTVFFSTENEIEEVKKMIDSTAFLDTFEIEDVSKNISISSKEDIDKEKFFNEKIQKPKTIDLDDNGVIEHIEDVKDNHEVHTPVATQVKEAGGASVTGQNYISVALNKLDILMDLVGELVISEAMVTRNPEVTKLEIDSFQKASRQHRKIISELQDMVMSVRMVPLTATFQKMNRIVRDMSKKLKKDVKLTILGEETEVDKNIIEHISDPLMHLIRNSIDHGIEPLEERISKNKPDMGTVILEAKSAGGDVIISVKDDGKGIDKTKMYEKAYFNGLTSKPREELTDKEIFSFIFAPGFSTKDSVSEYSGRGVGMDVVMKNIEKVGGIVDVESIKDAGTSINIKIPLTLAIIDGMIVTVGESSFIIPTITIKESFKPREEEIIHDPDGNEMTLIRGVCYPILRLHEQFSMDTSIKNISDGIIIMVEDESGSACVFVDTLIGEQQVVVKALPKYIKKIRGIAGCTLLGDGSISLIIDVGLIINSRKDR